MPQARRIDIADLGASLPAALHQTNRDVPLFVTVRGEDVAEIVPIVPPKVDNLKRPRVPGAMKGKIWMAPDFDE